MGIKHQTVLQENFSADSLLSSKGLLRKIFIFSFIIEIIGIILIYLSWNPQIKFQHLEEQLFYSIFHSVSAFNNAGFTLFTDGLYNSLIQDSFNMHIIIAFLILFGAIGFPVIEDIEYKTYKKNLRKC